MSVRGILIPLSFVLLRTFRKKNKKNEKNRVSVNKIICYMRTIGVAGIEPTFNVQTTPSLVILTV